MSMDIRDLAREEDRAIAEAIENDDYDTLHRWADIKKKAGEDEEAHALAEAARVAYENAWGFDINRDNEMV